MKKTVVMLLAVVMAVSLVSCYKLSKPAVDPVKEPDTEQTATEPDVSVKEGKPEDEPVENKDEKTAEIIYNGRVDMNFVEVSFGEGEYAIMQLSEEIKESFDSLEIEEGSKIEVVYTEQDGRKIIRKIKR